ncbi:hypothetical protein QTI24_25205 [Variovorax sp. J22P240]|uniref:hypothetical protein n=1 Tax=Variovorax sp. J22P240 TaxID=3053514 RepID=UPI00257517D9|nr:hypothetical protein [Variovorax sp. J22P240]MDM0001929.1 hypothetical protein [Variovorax sp. J22P240]
MNARKTLTVLAARIALITFEYFRADGRYVFMDSRGRRDPEESPDDRWRAEARGAVHQHHLARRKSAAAR